MRVLVLSSTFPSATRPTYGVFVRERVRHLATRSQVVVVAPVPWFPFNGRLRGQPVATTPTTEDQDGLRVYHPRFLCPPLIGKTLDAALYVSRLLPFILRLRRRFAFDVIDAHFTYPDGVAGVALGALLGVPAFVTIRGTHDLWHARFRLRRAQVRWALGRAAGVIAVSDSLRRFAEQLGAEPRKVRLIANGVDTDRFTPGVRADARARLGLPADRTILLSVGALVEGKGHHRVVETLPELLRRRPELLYVVVGGDGSDGDGHRALDALVRRARLERHVKLVGARPHHEIVTWMAAADLFCLGTRSEGWCNALSESLACGLPVVTTAVGGNPEVVREDVDGFLVPFWDRQAFVAAVLRALDRRWDRAAIASRARDLSWHRTAEATVETLAAALVPTASKVAGVEGVAS